MIKCKDCGTTENMRSGNRKQCIPCYNEYRRVRYRPTHTTVYYLPEEHYVGKSRWPKKRVRAHRLKGKITEGWEVLAKFERDVDAHWFEVMLHQRGYHGHSL